MKKSTRKRNPAIRTEKNGLKLLPKELAVEGCCNNEVDRINQLPDDILVSIISRLTFQEARATSIISTRWRHLCTYITSLNFYFPFERQKFCHGGYFQEIQQEKFSDYIRRIKHTLDSYKGGRILKEFRVHIPCLWGANIEKWLEFALSRKVEVIDIRMVHCIGNMTLGYYTFPLSTLISKNGRKSLLDLKCLKELSLSGVHIDDRDVELLISKFVVLERLSIDSSRRSKNVNVVGHSECKLKHLNISNCWTIESIEVRDMINLVSLRCYRLLTYVLLLSNVPKLVEFNTCDASRNTLAEILPRIASSIHDQLLHLKLSTVPSCIMSQESTYMLPKLINLKYMELKVVMDDTCGTYQLFPLIEACPSLEKLETKAKYIHRRLYKCRIRRKDPNYNLRKVRLSGYFGSVSELEFALYVMNNAVALKELIVEACHITREIRRRAIARACHYLQSAAPNSVELVIM